MLNLTPTGAMDVPGFTLPEQHEFYTDVVKKLPKNPRVLEIGCGWGRSTWAWLDVLPETTEYYILDNFWMPSKDLTKTIPEPDPRLLRTITKNNLNQRQIFNHVIRQHKNFKNIKEIFHIDGAKWATSNQVRTDFDLVYIDDDHKYAAVKRWLDLFIDVPIICGDDYHPLWPGVVQAVDEHVAEHKFKLTVQNEMIMFFTIEKNG